MKVKSKKLIAFLLSLAIIVSNVILSNKVAFADSSQPSSVRSANSSIDASQIPNILREMLDEEMYVEHAWGKVCVKSTTKYVHIYIDKFLRRQISFPPSQLLSHPEFTKDLGIDVRTCVSYDEEVINELFERDCEFSIEPIWMDETTISAKLKLYIFEDPDHTTRIKNEIKRLNLDGKSDFEKVKAIYNFLVKDMSYTNNILRYCEEDNMRLRNMHSNTGCGALKNKVTACKGAVSLFHQFCKLINIESRCVAALAHTGNSMSCHAWNLVKIDNFWYNIDCTNSLFLLSNETFLKDMRNKGVTIAPIEPYNPDFCKKYPISKLDYYYNTWYNRLFRNY